MFPRKFKIIFGLPTHVIPDRSDCVNGWLTDRKANYISIFSLTSHTICINAPCTSLSLSLSQNTSFIICCDNSIVMTGVSCLSIYILVFNELCTTYRTNGSRHLGDTYWYIFTSWCCLLPVACASTFHIDNIVWGSFKWDSEILNWER